MYFLEVGAGMNDRPVDGHSFPRRTLRFLHRPMRIFDFFVKDDDALRGSLMCAIRARHIGRIRFLS